MLRIQLLFYYLFDIFLINYGFSLYYKYPFLITKTNNFIAFSYDIQSKFKYESKIAYHKSYHVLYNNNDNYEINQFTPPKLDYNECYYEVLEVHHKCDAAELKKAYYKIVFKYHPDNKETEFEKDLCNKQMMVINGAYRVLKDPSRRKEYDQQRLKGLFGAKAGVKGSGTNDPNAIKYQYSKEQIDIIMKNMKATVVPNNKPTPTTTTSATTDIKDNHPKPNHAYTNKSNSPSTKSPSAARFWSKYADYIDINDNETTTCNSNQNNNNYIHSPKKHQYNEVEDEDYYDGFGSDGYFSRHYKSSVTSSNASNNNKRSNKLGDPVDDNLFDTMDSIHVIGRGDGSLPSLKLNKQRKENIILLDNRDWGEVTDYAAIDKRLQDIQEIKNLELMIADVEDEIENMTYRNGCSDNYSARNENTVNQISNMYMVIDNMNDKNQIPWWKQPANHPYNQPQPRTSPYPPDPWEQYAGSSSSSSSSSSRSTSTRDGSSDGSGGGNTKKRIDTIIPPNKKPPSSPPTERLWRDRNKR